jgi:hypothetical protein
MSTAIERYQLGGWNDPRTIYNSAVWIHRRPFGREFKNKRTWTSPLMPNKRTDAHEYTTEAKDLPIEVCRSMWIIKYGDGPIDAKELVEQDDLIWEIGNRLFWAGLLEHDQQSDRYTCRS